MLAIITFMSFKTLRTTDNAVFRIHLMICKMLIHVVFLLGVDTAKGTLCVVVACTLHVLILFVCFWSSMLSLQVGLLLLLPVLAKSRGRLPTKGYYGLFTTVYGLPVIIVLITFVASKNYTSPKYCWLYPRLVEFSVVLPAFIVMLPNPIVFFASLRVMCKHFRTKEWSAKERVFVWTRGIFTLLTNLNMTFFYRFFHFHAVLCYPFILVCGLQGVIAFLVYCVMVDKVRNEYYAAFERFAKWLPDHVPQRFHQCIHTLLLERVLHMLEKPKEDKGGFLDDLAEAAQQEPGDLGRFRTALLGQVNKIFKEEKKRRTVGY
jgi:hypothetical protein